MDGKLAATAGFMLAFGLWAGCSSTPTSLQVTTGSSGGVGGDGSSGDTSSHSGSGAGTTASSTGAGASPGQAKAYFISTVYPDLATIQLPNPATGMPTTCAACHATGMSAAPVYLGADAQSSYNVITQTSGFVAAPANSLLLVLGSISHTGPGMNNKQIADVTHWLQLEVQERGLQGSGSGSGSGMMTTGAGSGSGMTTGAATTTGTGTGAGGGSGGTITLTEALANYGSCMDYNMWMSPPGSNYPGGLTALPNTSTSAGPCLGCHEAGLYGNWLSSNPQETFSENQMMPFLTRQVTGQLDMSGNFDKLVPADRWKNKGSEACSPGAECHPRYALDPNLASAIDSFIAYTIDAAKNGPCAGTGGGSGAGGGP